LFFDAKGIFLRGEIRNNVSIAKRSMKRLIVRGKAYFKTFKHFCAPQFLIDDGKERM
jgi:hypothetical protein